MPDHPENGWCCSLFRDAVSNFGKRGVTIAKISDVKYGLHFFLEFRAVASSEATRFRNESAVAFSLSVSQGIKFCPWCGQHLREYYATRDSLAIHIRDLEGQS